MGNSPSFTPTYTPSLTATDTSSGDPGQFGPQGRGIKTAGPAGIDAIGDTFQVDAATLTSDNVALMWTQPKVWTTSTQRSQLAGEIAKPDTVPTVVRQTIGGPLNPTTNEEFVCIARVAENKFVAAWEDQVKHATTNERIEKVLVQVYSGATGESTSSTFHWDANQEQSKPDIAYVTSSQVVVAYEVTNGVKFIRLRVKPDGEMDKVGSSHLVGAGTKPKVHKTSSGGFMLTYENQDDTFLEIYSSTSVKLVGPIKIGGADGVAYLSNGKIAVVWEMDKKVYYRLYRSTDGLPSTARFEVNPFDATSIQTNPAIVSMTSTGGFMITWQQKASANADFDIMANELHETGEMIYGQPFGVHSEKTTGEQTRPALAEVDGDAMLFAWNNKNPGVATTKVQYQIFDLPSTGRLL
jgi:hypothetical protein